eukprot:6584400-Ditylum_brightwellii.AAC.1
MDAGYRVDSYVDLRDFRIKLASLCSSSAYLERRSVTLYGQGSQTRTPRRSENTSKGRSIE